VSDPLLARLGACAARVNVPLESEHGEKIAAYLHLLERWNHSVNLTALPLEGFPDPTLNRLVGEPLAATALAPATGRWFDLGSGGGSPAIPIKVMRPGLWLTMVEARERKSAFLREVVRVLELPEARVMTARFGDMTATIQELAHLVTIRAVKVDDELVSLLQSLVLPDGELCLFTSQAFQRANIRGFSQVQAVAAGEAIIRLLVRNSSA
jgi:16S rRNA (guanine527-N7)-methyltransferase